MATRLNPYVVFQTGAREAMTFYQEVFGGELAINTFGEYGPPGDGVDPNGTMHAQLETPTGYTLMASDAPPGVTLVPGDTVAISISGDDGEQLRDNFAKLMAGGTVHMPLEKQIWGDEFGMGVDKFGVSWMVNVTQG